MSDRHGRMNDLDEMPMPPKTQIGGNFVARRAASDPLRQSMRADATGAINRVDP